MKTVMGRTCYSTVEEIVAPGHTALLLVDVQRDFISDKGHHSRNNMDVSQALAMLPRLRALLDGARDAGLSVVFIQQTTLAGETSDSPAWTYWKTRDGRMPDYTIEGSEGQRFVDGFEPRADEPIVKKFRSSAFHNTALDTVLRARGVESVVVSGVVTQGCVLSTALDASWHDYYVVVAEDCVASASRDLHDTALHLLRSRFDVVDGESLLAIWRPARRRL